MPSNLARRLRKNPTDAAMRLWWRLRQKQLGGFRFRRQIPLGPYVADFVCLSEKLVIEVDGGQHAEQVEHDAARTAWLAANGFRVLRFWNNEVLGNMEGVLQTILDVLERRG
jgi:very-short-patch-repair endonuclease